jgi:hypothetical protein
MNRPYIGLAKWIFPSYQHVCINEALSAYQLSALSLDHFQNIRPLKADRYWVNK